MPVHDAQVIASPAAVPGSPVGPGPARPISSSTDFAGAFALRLAPDRCYALSAIDGTTRQRVSLAGFETVRAPARGLRLVLPPSAPADSAIAGALVDADGKPVLARLVRLESKSLNDSGLSEGDDGRFRFAPIPAGEYTIAVLIEDIDVLTDVSAAKAQRFGPFAVGTGESKDVGSLVIVPPADDRPRGTLVLRVASPDQKALLPDWCGLEAIGGKETITIDFAKASGAGVEVPVGHWKLAVFGRDILELQHDDVRIAAGKTTQIALTAETGAWRNLSLRVPRATPAGDAAKGDPRLVIRRGNGTVLVQRPLSPGHESSEWAFVLPVGEHTVTVECADGRAFEGRIRVDSLARDTTVLVPELRAVR